jgi:hypothetical protein
MVPMKTTARGEEKLGLRMSSDMSDKTTSWFYQEGESVQEFF